MPLNETIETFGYLLREAEKLDLAYFCFLRYTEDFDAVIEGWVFYLVCLDSPNLLDGFVQANPARPSTMSSLRTIRSSKLRPSSSMVTLNPKKPLP
jgi:hypothetical protein